MRPYAVLLLLLPGLALAQQPQLTPGQRVRVTAPDFGLARAHATLEAIDGGELVLRTDATRRVPLASVARLEAYAGRRSHWLLGAGIGFVVGAGATYFVLNPPGGGSTALCDQSANQDAIGSAECLGLTALGGVAGAGLGALVGMFIKRDTWTDVPREGLRLSVVPQPNGRFTVAASLAF
ncbi:MAG: hypothetical protein OEY20_14840 [Gemmatimonadota bacterium]|nr:hypothetical protein [Gemmatimonadota bacterium]